MAPSSDQHHVVFIGGSFAALKTAHKIFKTVDKSKTPIHITMLAASSSFWWSVGSPRAMFTSYPGSNADSFVPIAPAFAKYTEAGQFTFVHGRALKVDTDAKSIVYAPMHDDTDANPDSVRPSTDAAQQTLSYDSLVVATGSRGADPLYSLHESHLPTLKRYEKIQKDIHSVSNVLIVGGGAAGVETAGEVGYLNKNGRWGKNVTILSGDDRLLPALRPKIGKQAQAYLEAMDVKVIHKVRVESSEEREFGKVYVKLSNGEEMKVEMLIQSTGRKAVSEFMPTSMVDPQSKQIRVDDHQRIKGAKNAYAVGDVASNSNMGLMHVTFAYPVTAANVLAEIESGGKEVEAAKLKTYKPITSETQIVPVGPQKGVGTVFGWQIPSIMVWGIKGRNLMFPMMSGYLDGSGA